MLQWNVFEEKAAMELQSEMLHRVGIVLSESLNKLSHLLIKVFGGLCSTQLQPVTLFPQV